MKLIAVAVFVCISMLGCSGKVPEIKTHAPAVLKANGFEIVGYQGYECGLFGTYGGCVWYSMTRPGSNILYQGCVSEWEGEYHIYNLSAINAISSKP